MKKSKPKQRTNWKQRAEFYEASADKRAKHIFWLDKRLIAMEERARHCEEVIGVQNALARRRETRLQWLESNLCEKHLDLQTCSSGPCLPCALKLALDRNEVEIARAESAEKRLAEFKRSEYFVSNACVECGSKREEKYMNYVCYSAKCLRACADKLDPIRTHWQRFKSFLKHWYVELVCLIVILCVTAGCVAYVYWPRG